MARWRDNIVSLPMSLLVPRNFRRNRRGNVAMIFALTLPVLMFGIGLAVDFGHASQVRTALNAAADAAALAALTLAMMQQSDATAQAAAENMFNAEIMPSLRWRRATRPSPSPSPIRTATPSPAT